MKLQPILNDSLVRKAVKFLVYVTPMDEASADAFLSNFASSSDESLVNFVQSIVVLISSASQTITTAAMEMLDTLIQNCPAKVQLSLIKTDLIPQLMTTLHPLSLSFTEAVDINHYLSVIIRHSLWLATQKGLQQLALEDIDEPEAVHETILKHVLAPSEKYIWHFCVNRFSIVDGGQSCDFLRLVARLLRICPYYEPVTDFILHMPVILTIPSCLTFFESDDTIWTFNRKDSSSIGLSFSIPALRNPHPPTPLCLSLTTHTLPLPSASYHHIQIAHQPGQQVKEGRGTWTRWVNGEQKQK
ncbi:hypothetical protein BLNAU_12033 [Blattamonas nauphoetae]|uniref:Uncharacterized protein n=1 Tax=Blattamonas nauphoetae TaxID=2049346 RepID=A0ABQ9XMQ3_9EUKA|nr:hypothetical protein BLNAU_12033 [Blattamonas nauphoetae]